MTPDAFQRKQAYLGQLREQGRSSPEGRYWHEFHLFLQTKRSRKPPPVPLILAASGASNSSKHRRLSEQLDWAIENGCFDDAMIHLAAIAPTNWNQCPAKDWDTEFWP
jgi:hypothetical protein